MSHRPSLGRRAAKHGLESIALGHASGCVLEVAGEPLDRGAVVGIGGREVQRRRWPSMSTATWSLDPFLCLAPTR
jgi:hypothetical protein